ncbi:hypothetical protein [Halarcobacter sp.]|uniref:hypothetical protein n=1 Tax=Halarcobacter sp. TaxID=2321133 RepID=UPI0029F52A9D|nr:hypothetical protein [Halarcobacter sp.]
MAIKIFYLIILYSLFSFIIYYITDFRLRENFNHIVLIIEIFIVFLFSIFLWINIKNRNIKYMIDSVSSFFGYAGVIMIFFGLLHFSLIYPTAFLMHKLIEQPFKEKFVVVNKNIGAYQSPCTFKIELKNKDISTIACVSQGAYKKIKLKDQAIVEGYKSFFGSIVNKVKIDHKTNKTVEPIN